MTLGVDLGESVGRRYEALASAPGGGLQEGPPDRAARGLVLAPDGSVCTMLPNESVVACFDQTGEVHRVPLGVPAAEFSVGTDGAVWVLGEQGARLPDRVR